MAKPRTLFEKIWDSHVVATEEDGTCLLYIDRHLTHEVTTPQPYEGLRQAGRKVRRTDATIAVIDHNIATDRSEEVSEDSQLQIDTLIRNCEEFGVDLFHFDDPRNGIVHIIGPRAGLHAARDDHRVRRQPHRDPRGVRRAGLRHRDLGGRARARDPDPDPGPGEGDAHHRQRRPAVRLHCEGPRPRDHRKDRNRGRHRPCHRVRRPRDRGALDGRPDDGEQHDHRGRGAGGTHRARRDDVRLPRRPAHGPEGRAVAPGGGALAHPPLRSGRPVREGSHAGRLRDRPAHHLGHEPRGRGADHRRGPGPAGCAHRGEAREHAARPRLHGPRSRART